LMGVAIFEIVQVAATLPQLQVIAHESVQALSNIDKITKGLELS
jgi:hypothetical protein